MCYISLMKVKIEYVKDMGEYGYKLIRHIVTNPKEIRVGRNIEGLSLKPREVLGLFILSCVVRSISGKNWRPGLEPYKGDGTIVNLESGDKQGYDAAFIEQVYVYFHNRVGELTSSEIVSEIGKQIKKKSEKGGEYTKNRHLLIFLDVTGGLDYQKVKSYLSGINNRFDSYWLFAKSEKIGHEYYVFCLEASVDQPAAYKLVFSDDFRNYKVELLGRL